VSKFHIPWKGPFEIIQRLSEVNYRVCLPGGPRKQSKVVQLKNLKEFHSRKMAEEPQEATPNVTWDGGT
jgi:hypothetical protein